MKRALLLAVLGAFAAVPAWAIVPALSKPIAVLRALNKVTARVEQLDVPVDQPLTFGTLSITVHACLVTPPEETPESAAFLDVQEAKADEGDKPVFSGWMFASSPALSAMEHPVYDIWVIGCKDAPAAKDAPADKGAPVK